MKRRKLKGRSTVLVFHSSVGNSWHETLSGISRYAAEADWRVQTFDHVRKLPARALKVNHDNTVFGRFAAIELISAEVAAFAYYGLQRPLLEREARRGLPQGAETQRPPVRDVYAPLCDSAESTAARSLHAAFRRWLLGLPKPCGLFAANDMLAAEALNICSELNVSVPGEMAILGIDDDEAVCENATVSLSSIRPNFEEAGRVAADFLEARMEAGGRFKGPFQRYFAASGVVRRASTRRLAYNDATVLKALEVIRRRACKGLKPKDVVSEMPESRRTIEYRFRNLRGRPIMNEILSVRLERAKQLLVRRDMPIEAIAETCGWKSTARLRTFFREVEGVSTSEWRAEVAPASERR